ncbi:putative pentatricopeptide repeat-containing protein At5g37570 [Herrania umbratica]|uniref:Pentatricopeptide repeat-containing protein At5g37570 n=1 Tax=Herrania umbratica TaxID=108875 RepID=A0A6J1AQC2_9ROSI|nr:putative pentatricopeptide repeat-containing protein At5g37570 [Herrania umbratica]
MPIPLPHFLNALPSLPTLLRSCKTQNQLHQIHAHIIKKGLQQDHFLITLFLSLSTSLSYSTSVFNYLFHPSTCVWNSLLKGYSRNSSFLQTLSLFIRMKRDGGLPDKYTYSLVIKGCSCQFKAWEGKMLHGLALKGGVKEDVFVGTSLVDFYGKIKEIFNARKVFDEMSERNVVSWTALVAGCINVGDFVEAKRVFDLMPERNVATWNALIGGVVRTGDLTNARKVFDEMPERNVVSYTTMIDGYAKAGDMASARFLFEQAPERDIVAWSALISGYEQNGQPNEAVKIFIRMGQINVKPDEFILVSLMSACSQVGSLELAKWVDCYLSRSEIDIRQAYVMTALIDMNAKCGNMDRAAKLFEEIPKRDVIQYCSVIQGLAIHGQEAQAVELFNRMISEGLIPDEIAFTIILNACSSAGLVEEGWHYFETMKNEYSVVPTPDHYACMVDLLSRKGRLKAAYELIKSMPVEPHAGAWGALLGACKLHCDVELGEMVAARLFDLEPLNAGNYVLLSNIYAAAEQWLNVSLVRNKMKERGVRKIPGCSWIYFNM